MTHQSSHQVAFLGFDQVQLLDLVGPLEAFSIANDLLGKPHYQTQIISDAETFVSDSHIRIHSDHLLTAAPSMDTLFIPGGSGTRNPATQQPVNHWLEQHFDNLQRLVTVCTGVFMIGNHPYLAGKEVVTHWAFADLLQERFPQLRVNHERLFIQQGKFYSSAGILSGIDLALHLIEQDCGVKTAASVAKYLVTYLKRDGHQSQFSEPLKFQTVHNSHIQRMNQWLLDNLSKPITVDQLAAHSYLSSRQLNRLINKHYRMSASKYIEHLKLEHSKLYLSQHNTAIEVVAEKLGFGSDGSFRRSFKRKYGIAPSSYQLRFH